ncbi:MAG: glycosyltransferase family 9 protein [Elusimicrobia bacterium]|nr:glycosyltransferase family 9 protein [Elusimicrobiota bacterium]
MPETPPPALAPAPSSPPTRILVIMLRRIGDVILTTPAVRALKKLYPQAEIDFLTEAPSHQVLEGNPDLHEILIYDRPKGYSKAMSAYFQWINRVRAGEYDWVIDYMANPRSAMITAMSKASVRAGAAHSSHRWAYSHLLAQSPKACYGALEKVRVLRSIGLSPDESDFLPSITLAPEHREFAERAIRELTWNDGKPIVGFVPASRKDTRRWPARSYAELGDILRKSAGARLLVFWGPGEEDLAKEIVRGIGRDSAASPATKGLKDLAALLERCKLVVTNCNGPKHLAVACRVPTLTIHGSSDPASWNPPDNTRHQIARLEDLFCIGCRHNECPYKLECMTGLSPERVGRQALEMLDEAAAAKGGAA